MYGSMIKTPYMYVVPFSFNFQCSLEALTHIHASTWRPCQSFDISTRRAYITPQIIKRMRLEERDS